MVIMATGPIGIILLPSHDPPALSPSHHTKLHHLIEVSEVLHYVTQVVIGTCTRVAYAGETYHALTLFVPVLIM